MRIVINLFLVAGFVLVAAAGVSAQRASVTGAEVTGTFSTGGEGANTVKIAALGGGKLRVAFSLNYIWKNSAGEWLANTGEPSGIAEIDADTAVLDLSEEERVCRITIRFVKPGTIEVSEGDECAGIVGGMNVTSAGTYKKVNSAKPKFNK
jgi:hypothetical protein